MTYVVLNKAHDTVENIAESRMALDVNWIQIPTDLPVSIGDSFDGAMFYSPSGELRMSYVNQNIKNQVNQSNDKITDLETAFDALMGGVSVALGL